MNDLIRQEIEVRIAGKVWHFRELYDLDGHEDTDRAIASDLWQRGIRQTHRIIRALMSLYHDELQGKVLVEEAERIQMETNGIKD